MFNNKKVVETEDVEDVAQIRQDHRLEIAELNHKHKLELQEKEFELKHFKDDEVKKLQGELHKKEIENKELTTENKMLEKIVDVNKDIVDVKKLVNALIEKLPQVDLKNLTINTNKD